MYNSILFHIIEAGDTYGIIFKKFLYSRIMQGFIVSVGSRCMLRIGEFSVLTQISIYMLRHYNEIGLLMPEYVD